MDADDLLNGRRVHEGEIIGEVSNFSMKEAGTSYHVHFDMQVPTKYGWVFVNPYMTLVTAYERLIGERGTELADPSVVATADPTSTGSAPSSPRLEPDRPRPSRHVKQQASRRQAAKRASQDARPQALHGAGAARQRVAHSDLVRKLSRIASGRRGRSNLEALQRARVEQLLDLQPPRRQALRMVMMQEGLERLAVAPRRHRASSRRPSARASRRRAPR